MIVTRLMPDPDHLDPTTVDGSRPLVADPNDRGKAMFGVMLDLGGDNILRIGQRRKASGHWVFVLTTEPRTEFEEEQA